MTPWVAVFACAALGYVLGSASGSLLLGRLRDVDIRRLGSGNAGGTNAFRTQGLAFAAGVVAIDVGKAALATALAWRSAQALALPPATAVTAAAFGAFVGHVWPLYHGFRGGKGAATVVGALLIAWPLGVVIGLMSWSAVLLATGWVSLATLIAACILFASSLVKGLPPDGFTPHLSIYLGSVLVLLLWTHRANIRRLREGTEHRFEGARLRVRRSRDARRSDDALPPS